MENRSKLIFVKISHTLIWIFFNIVIIYMFYAAVTNKLDLWLWICYAIIFSEGLILAAFKNFCPLTIIARKYSASEKANFDIYLPNWLAKYNKTIYTIIFVIIIIITIFQLIR